LFQISICLGGPVIPLQFIAYDVRCIVQVPKENCSEAEESLTKPEISVFLKQLSIKTIRKAENKDLLIV
jgi:hypothetical protein